MVTGYLLFCTFIQRPKGFFCFVHSWKEHSRTPLEAYQKEILVELISKRFGNGSK